MPENSMNHPFRRRATALFLLGLVALVSLAIPVAYATDTPPPPAHYPPPPPVVYRPAPPPPLSPAMRAVYAPFYAVGIGLHYGVYYLVVAPLEVFGRALNFGVSGGVEDEDRQAR
jgi:hypothetical protein